MTDRSHCHGWLIMINEVWGTFVFRTYYNCVELGLKLPRSKLVKEKEKKDSAFKTSICDLCIKSLKLWKKKSKF